MAVALFLPLIYDACRHRLLKPRMVHLIEVVLIPISSAVILFVPIYILALQPFTAPLLIPSLESNLVNLLFLYLVILGVGIVFLAAFSYFRRYLSNGDADDSSHKSET
jgi:hypothetical protein